MSHSTVLPARAAYSPLDLQSRTLATQFGAVVLGSVVLAVSSYIAVPMVPVPITMQTFAVTMIGALYGWRLGAITVIAWLAEGAAGLPVLAGGGGGAQHFVGPTAGYLFSFPIGAALTGWLAEKGWNGHRPLLAFASQLAANMLALIGGAAWLATLIGAEKAIAFGVTPFLVGAVVKSALGAAVLKLMVRGPKRSRA